MKINTIMLLTTFCLFLTTSCNVEKKKEEMSQLKTVKTIEPSITDVENAVLNFNMALVNRKKDVLMKMCADAITYGHSSGLIQNKSELIEDVVHGPFDFLSIDNPDQTIQIIGNSAIVRHVFLSKASKEGELIDIEIGNIQVFQMSKNGEWQLLARQAYKI